jgi:hypothetical protein
MFCVSVNLTSNEWMRIQEAAQEQFPSEVLSRAVVGRRFSLAGIDVLKQLFPEDRQKLVAAVPANHHRDAGLGAADLKNYEAEKVGCHLHHRCPV